MSSKYMIRRSPVTAEMMQMEVSEAIEKIEKKMRKKEDRKDGGNYE